MRCTSVVYCLISLLSLFAFKPNTVHNTMCLSKIVKQSEIKENLDFDFDLNWDKCDYISEELFTDISNTDRDLNIVHWNVRGLTSKTDELSLLLGQLRNSIDVISLNETWLSSDTKKIIDLPNYKLINKPRKNRKGGGVGFLIRSDVPHRRRLDLELDTLKTEHAVVELKCKSQILICSMYRPPNSDINCFLDEYVDLVTRLKKERRANIVICLDHNLDLLKHHKHNPTRKFIESTTDMNLLPVITKPTRITHGSATLIDNIMISEKLQSKYSSGIMVNNMSDHLPCYLTLPDETDHEPQKRELRWQRSFSKKNKDSIVKELNAIPWSRLMTTMTTNESFNYFHEQLHGVIDKCAPLKQVRAKGLRDPLPWLTNAIKRSIIKNKKLYALSIKPDSTDLDISTYKSYNKTLLKLKRHAKLSYYRQKCIDLKNNGAKLWALINSTIGKNNNKMHIIEKIKVDNIEVTKSEMIANEFGKYYSNIGRVMTDKVKPSNQTISYYIDKISRNQQSLYMTPTTPKEIEKLIMKLDNKSSSGHDHISNIMLKWLCPSILHPLSLIFNKSLAEGVFPDQMKLSDVISLYKGRETYLCNNYRPISLLLTTSKILEKIIYRRVYDFMQCTSQITNDQFGFRMNHSCVDAITNLCGEIIKNREQGLHTIGIFLDLSKAFDTLSHTILLNKLERYGIRGVSLDWFRSYLSNRKLRSKVSVSSGSTYSEYYNVTVGTPQGSCLGPLLFLMYINDLNLNLEYAKVILFADDTTIFLGHRNLNYLNWCLSVDLQNINDWFLANKLSLNIDKSHYIHFGKNTTKIDLNIDDTALTEPASLKFLGILLDKNLHWNYHVNNLANKLKRNLHLLRVGKNKLDVHTLKLIYHAHFESHLLYGLPVWGSMCRQDQLNRLQKIQRKALKQIIKSENFDVTCKKLKILPVCNLLELELLKLGFKLNKKFLPSKVNKLLREDCLSQELNKKHRYPTRNKNDLNVPIYKRSVHSQSFLVKGITLYNKASTNLKSQTTISSFISCYKRNYFLN